MSVCVLSERCKLVPKNWNISCILLIYGETGIKYLKMDYSRKYTLTILRHMQMSPISRSPITQTVS